MWQRISLQISNSLPGFNISTQLADSVISEAFNLGTELAYKVGKVLKEVVTSKEIGLNIQRKSSYSDLVTDFDFWSENEITKSVNVAFPKHIVYGEELHKDLCKKINKSPEEIIKENICWVVDPIDGTNNFANRIPHCCVSIGFTVAGERIFGIVYEPFRDELFTAKKGEGAKLNSEIITVEKREKLKDCILATFYPNDRFENWPKYQPVFDQMLLSCRNMRSMGAAVLDLCWLACGRVDAVFMYKAKPWDLAAASLIVEEAGGKISSLPNDQVKGFSLFGNFFLASNTLVFDELYNTVSGFEF